MFIIHYTQGPNQNVLDVNARPETVKLLKENIKGRLKGLVLQWCFGCDTIKAQVTKPKTEERTASI